MKSLISKTMALFVMATTLFSFTNKPGGEGFEIYVGSKLVIQRYGSDVNTVQSLQLDQQAGNEKVSIKYHHCGNVGKKRVVTIKNEQNAVLKEIRYADSPSAVSVMTVDVKDILALKKGNTEALKLFYTSSELPNGRLLTNINF